MSDSDLSKEEREVIELDKRREPVNWALVPVNVLRLIDHYYPEGRPRLNNEQVAAIVTRLKYPSAMARDTLPLVCVGDGRKVGQDACPYVPGCPLESAGVAPIGQRCPFESSNIQSWMTEYMRELQIEPTSFVEMNQIKEVILMDLIMQRAGARLSQDGLTDDNPVGIIPRKDAEPDVVYRRDPAALMEVLNTAQQRKLSILKSMLATRESKAKYQKTNGEDLATLLQKLMKKKEKLEMDNDH